MQKKVLLAFDDPGGGLAVITIIEKLMEEKDLNMRIYAGRLNGIILKEKRIDFLLIDSKISEETSEKMIDDFNPDILISGTSGGNAEQELRNAAFKKNIKSLVILDFWKDYSRRWLYASYPLDKLHDKVCVMDEETKKEMIEEKFTSDRLLVTGNPYLDKIFNYNENNFFVNNEAAPENNYLFLSQPLNIIGIENYKIHPLEILLQSLKEISDRKKEFVTFKIRLHPLETELNELSSLVSKYDSNNFIVEFSDESKSLKDLVNKSRTIIGFNTIAMFEAAAMGKRTISLNVVEVKKSLTQAMNAADIEIIRLDKNEIINCLLKKYKNERKDKIFQGGIENCMKLILSELNTN
ncbi:MAG: hypothetical protein M3P82_04295 [Bacteroidota bacterium]|nr:hypothetical protein [Bacteroidota bacterium]